MVRVTARPGPTDSLTDVAGLRIGEAADEVVRTGVTVVVPDEAVAMGVDVRGGGPGTRDTDALDPTCLVEKFHAVVLSGGSVFGLAAADGVVAGLSEMGVGLPFGPIAVPVVPSAILFDLANGGDKHWGAESPYRRLGLQALGNLSTTVKQGRTGAGFGAMAGGATGGLGSASLITDDGLAVSALVAVNSFGSVMTAGAGDHGVVDLPKLGLIGANTTIGVVATNVALDKAGCRRLAIMAQDGLARTIRPIHTPFDGDTIFALSTGRRDAVGPLAATLAILGTLAADCVARAVEKAIAA